METLTIFACIEGRKSYRAQQRLTVQHGDALCCSLRNAHHRSQVLTGGFPGTHLILNVFRQAALNTISRYIHWIQRNTQFSYLIGTPK